MREIASGLETSRHEWTPPFRLKGLNAVTLKARGGGLRVNKYFSHILTHMVALFIFFPKSADFRPFLSIGIGKSSKFAYKFLYFLKI